MFILPSLSPTLGPAGPRPRTLEELLRVRAPNTLIERTLQTLRSVTQAPPGHSGPNPPSPTTDPTAPPEGQLSMEQLVHDHADAVYRVALSVTRDPILAEDVSQDALIKAWQALPTFRGDSPLRNWMLRITHNVAISTLRRRREDVVAPFDLPERPATAPTVEMQVQDRLAIDRFEGALQELDGVSRSIVVLREVEGMSYDEMSDVLALPLPTIRTRLLRARRKLATALDGWQP